MTVEERQLIAFGEIRALEYECSVCGAKTSIPIDDTHDLPISCRHCADLWMKNGGSNTHQAYFSSVKRFREFLAEIRKNSGSVGCVLRLELKPPAED